MSFHHKMCRGSSDATKQASSLISTLIKEPEVDILQVLAKNKLSIVTSTSWDKSIVPISTVSNFLDLK